MIRKARAEDLPNLITLLRELHQTSPYAHLQEDVVSARKMLAMAMASAKMFLWVSEKDDRLLGFLLGAVDHIAFPVHGRQASDVMFYVREGGDGYLLAKRFLAWGWAQSGVKLVGLSVSSGVARSDAFVDRLGLRRVGGIFLQFDQESKYEQST
jgi:hypothetical protein